MNLSNHVRNARGIGLNNSEKLLPLPGGSESVGNISKVKEKIVVTGVHVLIDQLSSAFMECQLLDRNLDMCNLEMMEDRWCPCQHTRKTTRFL